MHESVAIIGAGMAGATCARALAEHGVAPVVFDKSRGAGGRMATRRAGDALRFDHGGQCLEAERGPFRETLRGLEHAGALLPWVARIRGETTSPRRLIGAPTMSAPARHMLNGLDLRAGKRVSGLRRETGGWRLDFEDGASAGFQRVVLAIPAPQAEALLRHPEPALADEAASVSMAPCWTAMIAFERPIDLGFEISRSADGPLSWISREDTKPGRPGAQGAWVAQASAAWTRERLDARPADIAAEMAALFAEAACCAETPAHCAAHRWLYARTETPLGRPFLTDEARSLYVIGDWTLGSRVEDAFDSGRAAAVDAVSWWAEQVA